MRLVIISYHRLPSLQLCVYMCRSCAVTHVHWRTDLTSWQKGGWQGAQWRTETEWVNNYKLLCKELCKKWEIVRKKYKNLCFLYFSSNIHTYANSKKIIFWFGLSFCYLLLFNSLKSFCYYFSFLTETEMSSVTTMTKELFLFLAPFYISRPSRLVSHRYRCMYVYVHLINIFIHTGIFNTSCVVKCL